MSAGGSVQLIKRLRRRSFSPSLADDAPGRLCSRTPGGCNVGPRPLCPYIGALASAPHQACPPRHSLNTDARHNCIDQLSARAELIYYQQTMEFKQDDQSSTKEFPGHENCASYSYAFWRPSGYCHGQERRTSLRHNPTVETAEI